MKESERTSIQVDTLTDRLNEETTIHAYSKTEHEMEIALPGMRGKSFEGKEHT